VIDAVRLLLETNRRGLPVIDKDLSGRWYTFDARHNHPRIGRILMGTGRDAADVALTTSFGRMGLIKFLVISEEVSPAR